MTPTFLAELAVDALKAEALLTPKPGLVDQHGSGGHSDMDLPMLLRSADALFDTFRDLAAMGASELDPQHLRDRVGMHGRIGEAMMLDATGGVNTHRGALWTLGLLVTAAASANTEDDVFRRAAAIARTPDSAGTPAPSSHGQRAMRQYGVVGAVGEATAGFPHIVRFALPELRRSLAHGSSGEGARLRALLALIAMLDDTCILHRGGIEGLRWMQVAAKSTLASPHFEAQAEIFCRRADELSLSAGGSADLLSGAIFVHTLESVRLPIRQEEVHAYV
jgi:triphosphoribosyl-dephospho-CoA synthase